MGLAVNAGIDAEAGTVDLKMQGTRIIVDGVERGRPRIRVGRDAVAIDLLCRAAPTLAPKVAVAFEKRLLASERSRSRH